ncbi:transposase [Ectopseudomonas mendocina]|uniref:Transposase n=1 Tax=Ectopseudomonas mendocina TaxID=300 RepID=A0A379IQQ0_ECTME|nr:transposase [Pseudomonas mendocina]
MGQLPGGQARLFYSFNLEDHISPQHLLRSIDQCLDLSDLRAHLADFYRPIGRPSIDPELMVRMLVVGRLATAKPPFSTESAAFCRFPPARPTLCNSL